MRTRCIIIGLMVISLLISVVALTGVALAANNMGKPASVAPTGITLPPGMTLGPYGKVIPESQRPTPQPTGTLGKTPPTVPGGPGIVLPPGMTLGAYGKVIPESQRPTPLP